MNNNSFIISILAAVLLGLYSCQSMESHEANVDTAVAESPKDEAHAHGDNEIVMTPEKAQAAGITVEEIQPTDFAEVIRVSGSVLPTQGGEATVFAKMTGIVYLKNNTLNEGSRVNAGQTLFDISIQTVGDGNPVAAAKAELEAAKKDWQRAQLLVEDKIISAREFEDIRLRYETAKTTSESLGNGKQKQTITAPMNGYVQNLLVKNGEYVTAGQALATITQNKDLQLRAEVPERYYAALNNISSANFQLTYDPQTTFELHKMNGRLISSARTANKGDGFLPVTFEFSNIGQIIPGSLAEIYLIGHPKKGVITAPISALTEELGLFFVYLQTSDHSYEKREIKKGASDGTRVEILQGLHFGEKLVTQGAIAIKLAANSSIVPDAHAGHNH